MIVTGVSGRGYAARVGIRRGDVIQTINGRAATAVGDLQRAQPGSEIVINRGGRLLTGRI